MTSPRCQCYNSMNKTVADKLMLDVERTAYGHHEAVGETCGHRVITLQVYGVELFRLRLVACVAII